MEILTHTLAAHPRGTAIMRILAAGLNAVAPAETVRRFVRRQSNRLTTGQVTYNLDEIGRIAILSLGKASLAMTQPVFDLLADHSPRGLLIPKYAPVSAPAGFEVIPGGHPVPTENSLRAGQRLFEFACELSETDLLICLISGGGSALVTLPHPGVTLADMQALTSALLACGARIDEINTLRRHLDQIKGGGLAKLASPARVASLILSDVVNNPLEAIASGPTAPDPSTREEALSILERYQLLEKVPQSILSALKSSPETPKPGADLFERVQNVLVGSNQLAAQAALEQAQAEGFHTKYLGSGWQGEARDTAQKLCAELAASTLPRPLCLVAGGETTVTLRGNGLGGRNMELALASVPLLAKMEDAMLITLATDGEDGPTDAAGAVVTPQTAISGLDVDVYLSCNDSYNFFNQIGDLLKPGPTGTNVNDLTFLFAF